jgi:hypothetical protein
MARGPWDPRAAHGGAPAALMVDRLARMDVNGRLTRATVELVRPVPLTPLSLELRTAKKGSQVQRTEAALYADDLLVARAEGLHVTPLVTPGVAPDRDLMRRCLHERLAGVEEARPQGKIPARNKKTFSTDAMEIRFIRGRFSEPGPGAAWFRLKAPVVNDETPHPWARIAAASDFSNGVSSVVPWTTHTFANADLVMSAARLPVGEWIGLSAVTHASADGIGVTDGQLFDAEGALGSSHQSLLIRPRPPKA